MTRRHEQPASAAGNPVLFRSLNLRGLTLPNRIGVSPMCMYASIDGAPTDFHLVHLGRFALGGAGIVMVEATAIEPEGRISHHDLGIWSDAHVAPLARIATFLTEHGSVPAIQLAHAGRRASVRQPWRAGLPLDSSDADSGYPPWPTVGPTSTPAGSHFPVPRAMSDDEVRASIQSWASAARRAVDAGFALVELHGAHGYLLHTFVSPLSNLRRDRYGGSVDARMRYPLEVVEAIRAVVPPDFPIAYRLSAIDGAEGGYDLEQVIEFARRLGEVGVDLIDTSSGGISTERAVDNRLRRTYAIHADLSRAIRDGAAMTVATVGLIVQPEQAALLIEGGDTDLVFLGREMLDDPNWAHHARRSLAVEEFSHWDVRFGSALGPRAKALARLAEMGETPLSRFT